MEYFLALHSQVYTFIYHIKKQSKFCLEEIINYLLGENTDICQKNLFQIIHVLLKQHPVQSYLQNYRIYFIRNLAMQQLFTGNLFKMDLKVAVMKIQCFPMVFGTIISSCSHRGLHLQDVFWQNNTAET